MSVKEELHELVDRLGGERELEALAYLRRLAAGGAGDPAGPSAGVSLSGLARDLGPTPSAEEIDAARRESWAGFGREDG